MSVEDLAKEIKPFMVKAGLISEDYPDDKMNLLASTWQSAIDKFSDAPSLSKNYYIEDSEVNFDDEARDVLKEEDSRKLVDAFLAKLAEVDKIDQEFASTIMKTLQKETGIKGKNLWFPIRAAITGSVHGPDLTSVMLIMGKEKIANRLNYVKENL